MKPIKNQPSSISGLSALPAETQICFGAAVICFGIGIIGHAFNVLTSKETTLSAFLVISAFYVILGVASFFKGHPEEAEPAMQRVGGDRSAASFQKEFADEAAA